MSYILEALKKADQERSRGAVPDLRAGHRMAGGRRDYRRLALVLILLFLGIQALLLFLYLRGSPSAPPAPVAREEPPPSRIVAPPTSPAALPAREAPEPDPTPAIVLAPPSAPTPRVQQVPSPVGGESTPEETPVYSINPWQQGSAAVQQLAVGISLDVHVYAEQPAQRFVLINMNRYREGDRLKEGAVLERITPEGVVLSYQGEQFRYDRP
ncbi:MAG: general secretion pathway protein GspB [Xanthomonadaceae bacterium]|nr:general secretion pathway protein GspB [Xanthomonadaceae bacterium]